MEATPSSTLSLPKPIDISSDQLRFLNHHFPAQEDVLHKAPPLLAALRSHYSDLNSHLQALQTALTQRTVSWIRLSSSAKTTLHNLHISLQNLSLLTSQYGSGLKKLQRVLGTELPQLAREVLRIETIRSYLETTLQLEARVGDLEDAVFCFVNFHGGKMFSGMLSNSSDAGTKHEKLLQAIKALNDLEVLVDVMKLQPQWHHLLTSVDGRVDKTLAILRPQVFADHRSLLASLGWPPKLSTSQIESEKIAGLPNPLVLMQGEKRKSYSNSFLALCALQHLQTRREKRQLNLLGQEVCMIQLWAIDELVSPIASRLEYHFSKWIDQPELIFALAHKTTRGFIAGVDDVLQPLIDKARLVNYSAKEAWVAAMVQLLSEFLAKSIFTDLAERYKDKQMKSEVIELWLHLVDLIVLFDKQMQSLVSSDVTLFLTESERVESLSGSISALMVFCKRPDWLKIWGKIELKNACRKFKTDLKSERAWLVDEKHQDALQLDTEFEQFLLSTREDYRAPLIAESALRITWEMVEKCQTMPSTLARIQFVRSTAVRFLWYFFKVLLLRCNKTEISPDNLDDDALVRLSGSVNASKYVESKLRQWSDDVNFLEMKVAENDTSDQEKDDSTEISFFREEIKSLSELATNWLLEIISVLLRQFETLSWEYVQKVKHYDQQLEGSTPVEISAAMDITISVDFIEPLDVLRSHLMLLRMRLNPKDFLDLWRSVSEGLDHFISSSGIGCGIQPFDNRIKQFETDMQALFSVFQPFCVRPEAFFPRTIETIKLLKMNKGRR
ncbi:RINT1-like protein MAG2L [Malus sylvestris]|uniref:RINT1-like protein MAG2L n=1 Tax=Malus sylvestris TaxID=3752 RepID=UPI0021ABD84E|nr:RINT1-like protein MAG2L [Malus sylvestris]